MTPVSQLLGGALTLVAGVAGFFFWQWGLAKEEIGRIEAKLELSEALNEALEEDITQREITGIERAEDEKELRDEADQLEAARSVPEDTPAKRRARRLCERLRQQRGESALADHPTCGRFRSGG